MYKQNKNLLINNDKSLNNGLLASSTENTYINSLDFKQEIKINKRILNLFGTPVLLNKNIEERPNSSKLSNEQLKIKKNFKTLTQILRYNLNELNKNIEKSLELNKTKLNLIKKNESNAAPSHAPSLISASAVRSALKINELIKKIDKVTLDNTLNTVINNVFLFLPKNLSYLYISDYSNLMLTILTKIRKIEDKQKIRRELRLRRRLIKRFIQLTQRNIIILEKKINTKIFLIKKITALISPTALKNNKKNQELEAGKISNLSAPSLEFPRATDPLFKNYITIKSVKNFLNNFNQGTGIRAYGSPKLSTSAEGRPDCRNKTGSSIRVLPLYLYSKENREVNKLFLINKLCQTINTSNEIKIEQTHKNIVKHKDFDSKIDSLSENPNPVEMKYYTNSLPAQNWNFNPNLNNLKLKASRFSYSSSVEANEAIKEYNFGIRFAGVLVPVPVPVINQYLKSMSKYNMSRKGIFINYSNILGYNFNYETDKLIKNSYKFLAAFFKSMNSLISKPVFIITPEKITIQLFYFLCIPDNKVLEQLILFKKKARKKSRLKDDSALTSGIPNLINMKNNFNKDVNNELFNTNTNTDTNKILPSVSPLGMGTSAATSLDGAVVEESKNTFKLKRIQTLRSSSLKKISRKRSRLNKLYLSPNLNRSLEILKNKKNFTVNKLILLYKSNLIKVFSNKLEILCEILSRIFKKPVELNLIRLHHPYHDSNILVNLLGLVLNKNNLRKTIGSLYENNDVVKNLNNLSSPFLNSKTENMINPAFVSGLNIKVAGRLIKEPIIPRLTVKNFEKGAVATGKVNFLDVARITKKNKKGTFSITVSSAQKFF